MEVSIPAFQGGDKYALQAYQRWKDEVYFYNMNMRRLEKAEAELERLQDVQQRIQKLELENQRLELKKQKLRQQISTIQADTKTP